MRELDAKQLSREEFFPSRRLGKRSCSHATISSPRLIVIIQPNAEECEKFHPTLSKKFPHCLWPWSSTKFWKKRFSRSKPIKPRSFRFKLSFQRECNAESLRDDHSSASWLELLSQQRTTKAHYNPRLAHEVIESFMNAISMWSLFSLAPSSCPSIAVWWLSSSRTLFRGFEHEKRRKITWK